MIFPCTECKIDVECQLILCHREGHLCSKHMSKQMELLLEESEKK